MFADFFLKRPRFAVVIAIIMCLAGGVALKKLPIALYPEITPPVVTVSAMYPGASADVIAKMVAIPIEKEVNGVEDMLYMDSSSDDSTYTLTVTFKTGTDPDMAQVKVQNRVQIATSSLPVEVTRQGVTVTRESTNMLGMLSFYSPKKTVSKLALTDFVIDNVKENLTRVDGVGGVDVYAASSAMRVWLNSDKMASLGLTANDVRQAIESQNYQPSLGKLGAAPSEKAEMVYPLKTKGRINEVADFREIIVRTAEHGGLVRLKDIAKVEYGEESYGISAYNDGAPSVTMQIKLSSGANAVGAMKAVRAELKRLEPSIPDGVEYMFNYDATNYINASVREVVVTLIETFALVVFVCWLFLQNWRTTFVPSVAIPVSLLATFGVMYTLDYSINMFTLFGLVLAIGSIVDNAIVVVERAAYLMNAEKMSPLDAAKKTMDEVSGALVAATMVMVAIFVPIACMGGITGKIYQQFAVTISTSLVFSLVNALTLSPVLCAYFLKPYKPKEKGLLARFNRLVNTSTNSYARFAALFARRIGVIAMLFGIVVVLNGVLFKISGTSFIPNEDQGVFVVDVTLPEGASYKRTDAVVEKLTQAVMKMKGVRGTTGVVGVSILGGRTENAAMLIVDLEPWEKRTNAALYSTTLLNKARAELSPQFPEASLQFFEFPAINGLGSQGGMDFRFQMIKGADYTKLDAGVQKFLAQVNQNPAFLYAFTTFTSQTPALFLEINREKAESLNVPIGNLYATLEAYLGSMYVNDVNIGTQVNQVVVQSDAAYRDDAENLKDIYVPSVRGEMVPLNALVTLHKIMSPRVISRYNQFPAASVTAMQNPAVSTGEAMGVMESLMKSAGDGFGFEWSGMSWQEKNNQGQLGWLVALAVTFAYLFLVSQYESWALPLSVLMSVAVASAGAMVGMLLTGLPLSIYAQLGIVMLVGLASKNAILIVEFAKDAHERRRTIAQSAVFALKERFRAVLMTAFTFILGVFPMLTATGAGANSRRAIGTPVFYGMLIGTVAGLFMIPLLYVLVQTLAERLSGKKDKKKMVKAAAVAFVLMLVSSRNAFAFDPLSVYEQQTPQNCAATNLKKKLGLNDLIHIGLCNNPDLKRGYMAVRASEAAFGASKAAYMPTLDATGKISATHLKGEYDEPAADVYKDMKSKNYSVNIALDWLLLDFGGRSASTDMMRAYMHASSFGYNAALHDLTLGVTAAYLDLLSAREVLKSAQTSVESYKKSYDETNKKYKVGKAATSDLLLAKTTYLRSQLAVTAAKNTIEKNQANLATLLNLPPETKFNLQAPEKNDKSTALQENVSVSQMIQTALKLRPELSASAQEKQAAKLAVTAAKSSMAPTVSLYGAGTFADRWKDDEPFKDGYPYTYGGEAGLVLHVPLFEGFSKMYGAAKAKYEYRQAHYAEKSTQDRVKNEVWSAYQDYKTALASYTINRDVLASAQENERVSHASYRAGKETLLNLLTVQAQLASARQELIVSFYTVLISKASLYRAIGKF